MSNYDDEQKAMDAAIKDEHAGLVLLTVGGTILAFTSIISVWIFVGWRSGSWFWFWMVLGLGTLGTGLTGAGALLRSKATYDFAAAGVTLISRARASSLEKLPPWEDVEHKAA